MVDQRDNLTWCTVRCADDFETRDTSNHLWLLGMEERRSANIAPRGRDQPHAELSQLSRPTAAWRSIFHRWGNDWRGIL